MIQDALAKHLDVSLDIDWCLPGPELATRLSGLQPRRLLHDSHHLYISQYDGRRSLARARCMFRALRAARKDANESNQLTYERLQQWQCKVLGLESVSFRTKPAYAKAGKEVYGLTNHTKGIFCDKLGHDAEDPVHPVAKAVRGYLDVCFFHPFADGNARLARLIFDYFFTRYGFSVCDVRPLFSINRVAGRREDYLDLLRLAILQCE